MAEGAYSHLHCAGPVPRMPAVELPGKAGTITPDLPSSAQSSRHRRSTSAFALPKYMPMPRPLTATIASMISIQRLFTFEASVIARP